jgi:hypothetical protein
MATKPQETFFEYEQKKKINAVQALELAKKNEKRKAKTHHWVISPDGKTSIYKKK